jgi:hypothetical protein
MSATAFSLPDLRYFKARATYAKRVEEARDDLATFIELVAKDENGRPVELAAIHRAWIWHVNYCWARGKHALILAPFGSGKCGPASHAVQMADGSVSTLGALNGLVASVIAYDRTTGRYTPAWGRCFDNGTRRVFRVNLAGNRSVEVTEEHPFLTVGGWVETRDLAPGRHVAVAARLPAMGHRRMRPGEAALLGFLIGDGSLTGDNCSLTNGDPAVIVAARAAAEGLGFSCREAKSGRGVSRLALAGGSRPWARGHGIWEKGSWTKVTPPAIFTAPPDQIAEYLGAYWACDGTLANGQPVLYSVNRALLEDARSLLLRFGVRARLRIKRGRYKGAPHLSWQLAVSTKHIEAFREAISIPGKKGSLLAAARPGRSRAGNGDLVPLEYRAHLLRTAHWHKVNTGVSLDQSGHANGRQRGTERETVRRAAAAEGNEVLLRATDPSLFWEEILSIEDLGYQPTFGLEVEGHHTYVSGDVIVHNSSCLAVPLTTWLVGRDPQTRVKIVSNADDFAKQRVQGAKAIIESAEYRDVFPEVRRGDQWSDSRLFVRRAGNALDPSIHARGVMTKGVGGRADYVIFDDICDQLNTESQALRGRVKGFARATWLSRLDGPHARALMIATAWHPDDATHDFLQDPLWCGLVQRVRMPDMLAYEQEVFGANSDYLDGLPGEA